MMTTFAVVNLLVGLIVNSMQDAHNAAEVERTDQYREDVINRLAEIERHLGRLDRADGPKP
jgi:voltage-gated sodium channel